VRKSYDDKLASIMTPCIWEYPGTTIGSSIHSSTFDFPLTAGVCRRRSRSRREDRLDVVVVLRKPEGICSRRTTRRNRHETKRGTILCVDCANTTGNRTAAVYCTPTI